MRDKPSPIGPIDRRLSDVEVGLTMTQNVTPEYASMLKNVAELEFAVPAREATRQEQQRTIQIALRDFAKTLVIAGTVAGLLYLYAASDRDEALWAAVGLAGLLFAPNAIRELANAARGS